MAIKDLAATAAKAAKRAGATVSGDPTLIARLKGEHAEVSTLMASILAKKDSHDVADVRERQRVFELIRENLVAHAKAEEEVVYPRFAKANGKPLHDEVENSYDDHHEIEALIDELHVIDPGTSVWIGKFEQLHNRVVAHVHEEENVVFPRAKEALSDDEFKMLDESFQNVEARVKKQVEAEQTSLHR